MSLDTEDTPVGAIIGLTFITIVVFIIIAITFDSCTDFEKDEIYRYCTDASYDMRPSLGESSICYDDDGNLRMSILNTGQIDFEGMSFTFKEREINTSAYMPVFSQERIKTYLGLHSGVEFNYINVTPLVFYDGFNETVLCISKRQKITRLTKCMKP